ncbi:hypothetical protein NJB1728216S_07850 [Mycobacterium marinum]|uniref:hypothetical protein n=1 Tax=Mycobacterium marinum TaxID=1781 RepID=UPI0021C40FBB|nr:hypothetical protein [Mycobacterium marinum]GJN99260.1 hypothetical protein NJB1808e29_18500 [Mycobacterium marinum]GJN99694.1 hypothetical protein NJB1907f34b_13560 [Mycobacterium marinum]GJO30916.1 hypothetical protein NJB1728e18_46830 [Mycobacterium marinum]GJO40682.1 hypothetical protein NJB1728e24_21860 [Mycobacterium marinum]GJO62411.1 hypothetical protein NJB1728216S_07850 [Mycobacterium marinum]
MTDFDASGYLNEHLYDELRYLLCAATEWHVQQSIPEETKPVSRGGYYVQVYAMDSATVRARALFEFFTTKHNSHHIGVNRFGLTRITSDRYENWKDPLNRYILHVNERPGGQYLSSFDYAETKHLKDMPVDFAYEAVRLWRVFIKRLGDNKLAELAQEKLTEAIGEAERVVGSDNNHRYGVQAIDWLALTSGS